MHIVQIGIIQEEWIYLVYFSATKETADGKIATTKDVMNPFHGIIDSEIPASWGSMEAMEMGRIWKDQD